MQEINYVPLSFLLKILKMSATEKRKKKKTNNMKCLYLHRKYKQSLKFLKTTIFFLCISHLVQCCVCVYFKKRMQTKSIKLSHQFFFLDYFCVQRTKNSTVKMKISLLFFFISGFAVNFLLFIYSFFFYGKTIFSC